MFHNRNSYCFLSSSQRIIIMGARGAIPWQGPELCHTCWQTNRVAPPVWRTCSPYQRLSGICFHNKPRGCAWQPVAITLHASGTNHRGAVLPSHQDPNPEETFYLFSFPRSPSSCPQCELAKTHKKLDSPLLEDNKPFTGLGMRAEIRFVYLHVHCTRELITSVRTEIIKWYFIWGFKKCCLLSKNLWSAEETQPCICTCRVLLRPLKILLSQQGLSLDTIFFLLGCWVPADVHWIRSMESSCGPEAKLWLWGLDALMWKWTGWQTDMTTKGIT